MVWDPSGERLAVLMKGKGWAGRPLLSRRRLPLVCCIRGLAAVPPAPAPGFCL